MLVEFSVANYRSIRERVTLSAVASRDQEHPNSAFAAPGVPEMRLLKVLAIYGANASGKSNVLSALGSMRDFVLTSFGQGASAPSRPFKLDEASSSRPTEFEVAFLEGEASYIYGFQVLGREVQEEHLSTRTRKPRSRERILFRRQQGKPVEFGPSWTGDRGKLGRVLREDSLLLSVAGQLNHPAAETVVDWFRGKLRLVPAATHDGSGSRLSIRMLTDGDARAKALVGLLRVADVGILDATIKQELGPEKVREALATATPRATKALEEFLSAIRDELKLSEVDAESFFEWQFGIRSVHGIHMGHGGREVALSMETEESAGTRKLFALAGPWVDALATDRCIVADELDTRLHPLITRFLIDAFQTEQNHGAQLIFATHDSGLLDADVFRRDQIWFTEKNEHGATDLYSLWDYKVRKDENLRTGYLKGRYGAIPFVGEWKL